MPLFVAAMAQRCQSNHDALMKGDGPPRDGSSQMIRELHIGVAAWIIQDGNYEDFVVGEQYRAALEFFPEKRLKQTCEVHVALQQVEEEVYDVVGRVAFRGDGVWVLDCGVLAFREEAPPAFETGTFVKGRVKLGIDPFFYKEYLKDLPGIPKLFYELPIARILRETTPWSTVLGVKQRRRQSRSFVEVTATNAWNDEDGHAHYILVANVDSSAA